MILRDLLRDLGEDARVELVQGRFVDALSNMAAQMTMDEMQNRRGEYVKGGGVRPAPARRRPPPAR